MSLDPRRIARQTLSLSLAVWFVFLSASVHLLHTHIGDACGFGDAEPCELELHERSHASGMHAVALVDTGRQAKSDRGLCQACLFLKNCKERADALRCRVPVLASKNNPLRQEAFPDVSRVVVSASPRAPPVLTV